MSLITMYYPRQNGNLKYTKAIVPEEASEFFEEMGFEIYQETAEMILQDEDDEKLNALLDYTGQGDNPSIEELDKFGRESNLQTKVENHNKSIKKKPGPKPGTIYKKRKTK